MAGVASVAYALPELPPTPRKRAIDTSLHQLASGATILRFTDVAGEDFGPAFSLPDDWWTPKAGGFALARAITIHDWPVTGRIKGIRVYRDGEWLFQAEFDHGAIASVAGDTVILQSLDIVLTSRS